MSLNILFQTQLLLCCGQFGQNEDALYTVYIYEILNTFMKRLEKG